MGTLKNRFIRSTTSAVSGKFAEVVDAKNRGSQKPIRKLLQHRYTERCLCVVIIANIFLCIVEADYCADGAQPPSWMRAMNYAFSATYTVETSFRLYGFGHRFWKDAWSVTDGLIVFIDDVFIVLSFLMADTFLNVSMMRLLRLVRISRSKRILRTVPELYVQIECLLGTLRPICWGLLLTFFTLLIFSVVGVMLIHPINKEVAASGTYAGCDRCPHAFQSVSMTIVTLSQLLLAGDGWSGISIPIIEQEPWSAIYFILAFVLVCLILLNVILAAVCDSAQQARADNDHWIAAEKDSERRAAVKNLLQICKELDTDQNGNISKEELEDGLETHADFAAIMRAMDLDVEDLEVAWCILDPDKSGFIDYTEFADQLYKMKSDNDHMMLVFIRYYVFDIRTKIQAEARRLNELVLNKVQTVYDLEKELLATLGGNQASNFENVAESMETGAVSREAHSLDKEVLNRNADVSARLKYNPVPPLRNLQSLLEWHWQNEQQFFVEIDSLLSVTDPRVHQKDISEERYNSESELLAPLERKARTQPLSPKLSVGAGFVAERSKWAKHHQRGPCPIPPEPSLPKFDPQGWPKEDVKTDVLAP